MDSIQMAFEEFFTSPLVAPMVALIILVILNTVLRIFAGSMPGWPGEFDWQKTPQFLKTAVLDKLFPLLLLGVAAYLFPTVDIVGVDLDLSVFLNTMYIGGVAFAIIAEAAQLRGSFPNSTP